ncbi:MAG: DNA-binding protein [Cyclobacteriaceae bacterium]|nr:DNA-binding protein [Cyclobacteriaceae bacterium]
MKFIKQIERLQKLNKLIGQQCTGCPNELAEKLNIKRSQLYEVLEQLKLEGAPIAYNRKLATFYYTYEFNLEITLQVKMLTGKEVKNIYGGKIINFINKILPSEETGRSNVSS